MTYSSYLSHRCTLLALHLLGAFPSAAAASSPPPVLLSPDRYDAEDRLIERHSLIHGKPTRICFIYDADGNRMEKTVEESDLGSGRTSLRSTRFLVDESNLTGYSQTVAELDPRTVVRGFLHGLRPVAEIALNGNSAEASYLVSDAQGSTRASVKNSAEATLADPVAEVALVTTVVYDAFGDPLQALLPGSVANQSVSVASSAYQIPLPNHLFSGERFDWDLGTITLRARDYATLLGVFTTADSFEGYQRDPLTLHRYLYCQDDPVNGVDPSGHDVNVTLTGQSTTQGLYQNSQALGAGTVAAFGSATRASLLFRLGAYAVLGTSIAGNIAMVTEAILKTRPMSLDFRRSQRFEDGDEPSGDLTVHRMGGRLNLSLTAAEEGFSPPGFSVIIGGTPQEAGHEFRKAFPFRRMIELSKTVGSAKLTSLRVAGFDVVSNPGTLLNHGRLFHQSRTAAPFQNFAWQGLLSSVFADTSVP